MKRISILLVALLCSVCFYGQAWDGSKPDKTISWGVRAGVNAATIVDDENYVTHHPIWTFHFGVISDINFVKSLAIETGLLYSAKGVDTNYYGSYTATYLEIPILALYRYYISDSSNLQLKLGPYVAYLLNDEFDEKFDAGITLGAGVALKKFYIGAQYDFGFYDVDGWAGVKNHCLSLSVGYNF